MSLGSKKRPLCLGLELEEQARLGRTWPALMGSFWPSQGIWIFFLVQKKKKKPLKSFEQARDLI